MQSDARWLAIQQSIAERKARIEELVAEGERPRAFGPRREGSLTGTFVVHKDTAKLGRWRVTKLDSNDLPLGHLEAPTYRDALLLAWELGADL